MTSIKSRIASVGPIVLQFGRTHRYLILLLLVETLSFIVNYRLGQFYANSDISLVELHPSQEIAKRFSIWQQTRGFGLELGEDAGWIVILTFYAALASLGFTALQINTIGNFLIYVGPSFAAYGLGYSIFFRNEKRSEIGSFAGFLSSISFSFYILAGFPLFPNRWPIIVIPFMLSSLLLAFETGKVRFWLFFGGLCYLNWGSFIGPGFLVIPFVFMTSYLVYHVLVNSPDRSRDIKRLLLAGSLFVVISLPMIVSIADLTFGSSFWQSPYLQTYTSQVFSLNERGVDNSDLFYGFRLIGSVSWNLVLSWTGQLYKPIYTVFTYNPLFVISSFFLPMAAFGSLIWRSSNQVKKTLIFLSALSLAFLFIMKGVRPPFGEVFQWLITSGSVFSAFRQPYDKIAPTLTYPLCICAAYTMVRLVHAQSKRISIARFKRFPLARIILVIVLIVIAVDSYPHYTGQILYPAGFFNSPGYYNQVAQYVDSNPTAFKVLGLPETYYLNCYNWGYCGVAFDGVNLGKPVIHMSYIGSDVYDERIIKAILDEVRFNSILHTSLMNWGTNSSIYPNELNQSTPINSDRAQYWSYMLQSSNIGDLLLRGDSTGAEGASLSNLDWERYHGLISTLSNMGTLSAPRQFGNVSVYHVSSFKPLIYSNTVNTIYASNNYDNFLDSQFTDARLHIFSSLLAYNTSIDFVSNPTPQYNVLNPARGAAISSPYIYAPISTADYANQVDNDLQIANSTLTPDTTLISSLSTEFAWLKNQTAATYVDFIQQGGNLNLLMRTTPIVASLLIGGKIYVNNSPITINQTKPIGENWFDIGTVSLNAAQLVLQSHMFLSSSGSCDYQETVTYINKLLDLLSGPTSVNVSGYIVQRQSDNSWVILPPYGGSLPYPDLCSLLDDPHLDSNWRKSLPPALGLAPIMGANVEFALVPTFPRGISSSPSISFKEASPDKYMVNIENASGPFWMSFLESYNPSWNLYLVHDNSQSSFMDSSDFNTLLSTPLFSSQHFLLNGFANSWYVDPAAIEHNSLVKANSDGTISFSLLLYFHPESLFAVAIVISLATGAIFILGVFRKDLVRLGRRIHFVLVMRKRNPLTQVSGLVLEE